MNLAVVLDTNVIISALFWNGPPREVLSLIVSGKARLLISEEILGELEGKLQSRKLARYIIGIDRQPQDIISDLRNSARTVEPVEVPENAVRDRKDRIILACAVGGSAEYIVSGDKDLTTLGAYAGISILTPAQFLTILG